MSAGMRAAAEPPARAVQLGWCAAASHCSDLLFQAPEPLRPAIPCPAIAGWMARTWLLRAPYAIDLELLDDGGRPRLAWGAGGPRNDVNESFALLDPALWPNEATPIVVWQLGQVFVADRPLSLDSCGPFLEPLAASWPGVVLPQRFRPDRAVRPVHWAFLWQEPARPLRIARGAPIQYLRCNGDTPATPVRLRPLPYSATIAQALAAGSLAATAAAELLAPA